MRNRFDPVSVLRSLRRFAANRLGVSAVTFAISFSVLAPMTMGIFDIYQMNGQRGKLQDALDAAALYAARSTATDSKSINTIGNQALAANLKLIPGATLQNSSFTLDTTTDVKVVAVAAVRVPALAPDSFTHNPVTVSSEVTRAGSNVEVSLVLDNTGSMAGAPLASLQSAANQLIDLVVSPTQTPYYSKIAIVPYSNSVNAGAYATTVRGALQGGTNGTAGTNTSPPSANFKFTNGKGSNVTFASSTCVSERTGPQAFTDASYTTAKVGLAYPPPSSSGNNCISATIQPLTSDKTALKSIISSLTANGSTAGHIGVAWGWYMISPNWGSLFPAASQPAAYGTSHLLKVMILMTDGAFNTDYCNGVISKDSGSGSGNLADHINCNAPNGDSFTQAQALCTAMKASPNNVIIYTVGFLHQGPDPQAQAILNNCATDAQHAYFPTTGSDLQLVFQAIGANINKLRLSR